MKKSALLLALMTTSILAAPINALDTLHKDLSNPDLYQSHNITLTKLEPHKFLFIPYTKEVIVENFSLTGPTATISEGTDTPYIDSISQTNNDIPVVTHNTIHAGVSINIIKLENSNDQILNFNQTELVSLKDFVSNDKTIQLPNTNIVSFSLPISSSSIEKTWTTQSGESYKLTYLGYKNPIKS